MKNKKIIASLISQYCDAYGYDYDVYNNKNFKDYINWLEERKKIGYKYLNYLYNIRKDVIERTTAEVNKKNEDSITKPFDTILISPYEYEDINDYTRIIPASMFVNDDDIKLYLPVKQPTLFTLPRNLKLVMTQNPYTADSILNWDELHNSNNYDIAVGIYGSIYDKDIKNKLEILKSLKEKIILGDYKYMIDSDNDNYYGVLVSDRPKTLKKNK